MDLIGHARHQKANELSSDTMDWQSGLFVKVADHRYRTGNLNAEPCKFEPQISVARYFIISPKLLPNLAYRKTMRVLCVINGPYVQDTERVISVHKRAKTEEMVHRKRYPDELLTVPANR
jgi:hypothetical protein